MERAGAAGSIGAGCAHARWTCAAWAPPHLGGGPWVVSLVRARWRPARAWASHPGRAPCCRGLVPHAPENPGGAEKNSNGRGRARPRCDHLRRGAGGAGHADRKYAASRETLRKTLGNDARCENAAGIRKSVGERRTLRKRCRNKEGPKTYVKQCINDARGRGWKEPAPLVPSAPVALTRAGPAQPGPHHTWGAAPGWLAWCVPGGARREPGLRIRGVRRAAGGWFPTPQKIPAGPRKTRTGAGGPAAVGAGRARKAPAAVAVAGVCCGGRGVMRDA